MWYWLRQFENMLFYLPFLGYALLHHIPYSTRCSNCGRRLFMYNLSIAGLCERCLTEKFALNKIDTYNRGIEIVQERAPLAAGLGHCYQMVAKGIGKGRILDVGCGSGILLGMLKAQNRELYGIDTSPKSIHRAKTYTQGVILHIQDARNMSFKSDTFDWLTSSDVLEHIEGDDALRECLRVLKPGGTALFVVPNGKGVHGKSPSHVHFFTFESFIVLLKEVGFEIVSGCKFGLYIPFLTHLFEVISAATGRRLPLCSPINVFVPESLATHFFIECRKPLI